MITASIIFFAVAAIYGIALAAMFFQNKTVEPLTGLGHGVIAAIGLVLLIIAGTQAGFTALTGWSLALFIIAAIGGVVMFILHITKGRPPLAIIGVHAIIAVIAFLLLLGYAFSK